jgi:hypothetical protein
MKSRYSKLVITVLLVLVTLIMLGPKSAFVFGSNNCFVTNTHPGPNVECECTAPVLSGTCPSTKVTGSPYEVCVGGQDSGYLICNNSLQTVGTTAPCEGSIRPIAYAACLLIAAACGGVCAVPPWAQCLICLAAAGPLCTGCNIWQCTAGTSTPIMALKVSVSTGVCPPPPPTPPEA